MPRPGFFMQELFGIDLIYSIVILLSSLFIYHRTKEVYELSSHEGVKYFGYTFLFFGLSFLLRPLGFFLVSARIPFFTYRHILVFFSVYAGIMAALSLLYSVLWKRFEMYSDKSFVILNILAVLLAASINLGRQTRVFIFLLFLVVFAAGTLVAYLEHRRTNKSRSHSNLFLLYFFLLLSWAANIASFFSISLSITVVVVFKLISTALFLLIVYRVLRITRVG